MEKLLRSILRVFNDLFVGAKPNLKPDQPYLKNVRNKKLINKLWSEVFYNEDNLTRLANGYPICSEEGYGLIYYYFINGRLRYIGQTRENSLKWRMTRRQPNGNIGYSYPIKRLMLNAFRSGTLQIQTKKVLVAELDKIEQQEIRLYSDNRLWNKEHNPHYQPFNRRF